MVMNHWNGLGIGMMVFVRLLSNRVWSLSNRIVVIMRMVLLKWNSNGFCVASYLSDCCRSVNGTSPVTPTDIIDGRGGSSLSAIVGIAVGVAAGLLLVTCGSGYALGSCRHRKDAETGSTDQKGTTNFQEDAGTIYNEVSEPHIGHVIDRNNSDGETIQVPMGLVVELPESETIRILLWKYYCHKHATTMQIIPVLTTGIRFPKKINAVVWWENQFEW
jgi:hypothetical protein